MPDYLHDLNEPQTRAVLHRDGPLLVLAGAGSGKTRVITRRIAHLVHTGVAPWNVLALTFTNKAAGEMQERVTALGIPAGATIGTFHSVCARLLREFAGEAGLEPNYSIYDRDDQLRITRQALERLGMKGGHFQPSGVHARISNAKNELKTPQQFAEEADSFGDGKIAELFGEYERLLRENNALDFDDLLLRTAMLLRDRPEVRALLGRRYRYVLIDEYQDTNHAQYIIAHGIAVAHENICATGDPDQSIYAWRGADIRNIMEFETDYPNAEVVRLEENYRSTQPILGAASRLIACNRQRKRKDLWSRREGGEPVRVISCDDERAEARAVAERIEAARNAGRDYGDTAVFYRVNSLSRVLEETLFRAGIPYRVARGVEFFNRREVKDLLAYLKLMVNPRDDLSCRRIINTPTRGIGDTTVGRLEAAAERTGVSMLAAAGQATPEALGRAASRVRAFADGIAAMAEAAEGRSVRDTMEDVYRRSGMAEALAGDDEENRQQRSNIDELISTAAEFDERTEGGTLGEYLYQVSLVSDLDHFEGGGGAVTLMTLHAAKGLEFPCVYVVGCEDGLLPFRREPRGFGRASEADVEEERRLAFVGMTRAQDGLTLTCARRRRLRGQNRPQAASPFLDEIGREHVEFEDQTAPVRPPAGLDRAGAARRGGFYAGGSADPHEEREMIEAIAREHPMPPEYEYLRPGCRVHHPKFGAGQVLKVSQPWPETRAEIFFQDSGPKTIKLAHTSVELLDGP